METAEKFIAFVPDDTYRTLPDDRRKQRYWSVYAKVESIDHWLRCIASEEVPITDVVLAR